MNNIDPNWFFSATAQSFAAIVAIIGGFILSRFLALSLNKRNYELSLEDLMVKQGSKLNTYLPKISEWRQQMWHSFIKEYETEFIEIGSGLKNEFTREFGEIEKMLPYLTFELKLINFIRIIHGIYVVSHEFMRSEEAHLMSIETLEQIENHIEHHANKEIFKRYRLDFDKYFKRVSSYIFNEFQESRHFESKSREGKLKKYKKIFQSYKDLEDKYEKLKPKNKEFIEMESNLRDEWEKYANLEEEEQQCKREIKTIKEDKIIKKSYTPLLSLFGFGVIVPLGLLIIDSIYRNVLCDFIYKIFYLCTVSGILVALIMVYLYFRDYLKFK